MASAVATPLEKQFSTISGIDLDELDQHPGSTRITLQFDLDRDIDGAALDVQSALSVAQRRLPEETTDHAELPQGQPGRPADPAAGAELQDPAALGGGRIREILHRARGSRCSKASRRCWSSARRNARIRIKVDPQPARLHGCRRRSAGKCRRRRQFQRAGGFAQRIGKDRDPPSPEPALRRRRSTGT